MTRSLNLSTQTQNRPLLPELPPVPTPIPPELAPPAPVSSMLVYVKEKAKWEYKVLMRNLAKEQAPTEVELTALGTDGWELVGMASDSPLIYFYFKRPKQ